MKYKVWKKRVQYFTGEDIVLPEGAVIIKVNDMGDMGEDTTGAIRIVFLEPVSEPSPAPTD